MRIPSEPRRRARNLGLRAGDWVEVKSVGEILATLDAEGRLDALPFMPEMLQYCGQRFQVFKSAHKGCDTIESWKRIRLMKDAVHLRGLRCDGSAHGGCLAGCLLYWKEAWLRRADGPAPAITREEVTAGAPETASAGRPACDVAALARATQDPHPESTDSAVRYRCQATDHVLATRSGRWWRPGPYLRDLASRNVHPVDFVRYGLFAFFNAFRPYPYIRGRAGSKTPAAAPLDLEPGEWVQVRTKDEILLTLNHKLRHRGLFFDIEMLPFCGRKFRVLRRVERLINERTGHMLHPRNACYVLEGVFCGGCLSRARMFCPRGIYPYWHDAWLQRTDPPPGVPAPSTASPASHHARSR